MEAYVTGVSKGTTPTTFSPDETVTRVQMTTFLQRSLDQGLTRANKRAALNQWWVPQNTNSMQTIRIGGQPVACAADGNDIWTSNLSQVVQVQANTGTILGTWTPADYASYVVAAAGKVYVAAATAPGTLYVIDPTQAPGPLTATTNALGIEPNGIAFDGTNLWTANFGTPGSVSIITPQSPYTVNTVSTGFEFLDGILYDGANIWVTDFGAGTLMRLDDVGDVIQTVNVGTTPGGPVFDGTNTGSLTRAAIQSPWSKPAPAKWWLRSTPTRATY